MIRTRNLRYRNLESEPLRHGSIVRSLTFLLHLNYTKKLVTLSKASCEPPLQEYLPTTAALAYLTKTNSISTRIAKIISLESLLLSELLSVSCFPVPMSRKPRNHWVVADIIRSHLNHLSFSLIWALKKTREKASKFLR